MTKPKSDPQKLKRIETQKKDQRLEIRKTYKTYINGRYPRSESGRYDLFSSALDDSVINVCRCSRKDFRDAVSAAREAQPAWTKLPAQLRGQILYRLAEMMEGRKLQFVEELKIMGSSASEARLEVENSIDRLVYYAGWSDKSQQIFSSVNPVASSYFNFSTLEPTGVVAMLAPEDSALLGFVSALAPIIVGGNCVVALAAHEKPLSAITLAELMNSADMPAGVVNILTGRKEELLRHFGSHMDVNAVVYCGSKQDEIQKLQTESARNLKRCIVRTADWKSSQAETPYWISETQEVKTAWHPAEV